MIPSEFCQCFISCSVRTCSEDSESRFVDEQIAARSFRSNAMGNVSAPRDARVLNVNASIGFAKEDFSEPNASLLNSELQRGDDRWLCSSTPEKKHGGTNFTS